MIVRLAKDLAQRWVTAEACSVPGCIGAYFAGSINWLPDDVPLAATSDVDVMVVLADPDPPTKVGKFLYRDVIMDVTYLSANRLQTPELILADYHLAGSFGNSSIIADPLGCLTELHAQVSEAYAKRVWVQRRCENAREKVLRNLQQLDKSLPFHDQVTVWLFAAGVMVQVLLVAGLKNPTVRRRYVAARELLADYGRLDFYETLLDPLGCAWMDSERVAIHLSALEEAFDAAKVVVKTPFLFASDISDVARPIAIDGSRDLIESGYHREAIFWMVATYSRCQTILTHDAPAEMQERHSSGYWRLLGDLGISSFADLERRGEQVKGLLPRIWEVAQDIMARNPGIEDQHSEHI
jgi:hypothetical protein